MKRHEHPCSSLLLKNKRTQCSILQTEPSLLDASAGLHNAQSRSTSVSPIATSLDPSRFNRDRTKARLACRALLVVTGLQLHASGLFCRFILPFDHCKIHDRGNACDSDLAYYGTITVEHAQILLITRKAQQVSKECHDMPSIGFS
jgi:hypothetical protein